MQGNLPRCIPNDQNKQNDNNKKKKKINYMGRNKIILPRLDARKLAEIYSGQTEGKHSDFGKLILVPRNQNTS